MDEMDLKNRVDILRPAPEIFQRLSAGLDLPDLPIQDVWEALGDQGQMKIREDLARLESIQERTGLGLRTAPDPKWFAGNMEKILGVRQSALGTVLTGMRRTYTEEESVFIDTETRDKVEHLEDLAWTPPEEQRDRHALYVWDRGNKRFAPNFIAIQEQQKFLIKVRNSGIVKDNPENEKLTQERVDRLQNNLRLIRSMHPINERIFMAKQGPSGLLSKPLKLAAFGAAAVLGVMSLIPILKKIAKGEDLAASDWPAAVWPALAAYLGGFVPGARKSQLERIAQAEIMVQGNEKLQSVVTKMGGKEFAVAAVRELHDLLPDSENRKQLKGPFALRKVSKEVLQSFTGQSDPEKSPLLKALSKDGLTDEDRYTFLGSLYDMQITKEENLDAMIAALSSL